MDSGRNSISESQWTALRYVLAVLAVLIAVGVRHSLDPIFGARFAFAPMLIAVTVTTWLGLGPSLVALLAAVVAAALLFLEPRHSLLIVGEANQLGFALNATAGMLIVVLAELTRKAARARGLQAVMAQLEREVEERRQAESRLRALSETLEERVRERSAVAEQRAEQLHALATRLTEAEERERRRLAEVLHDHLQQLLVAARFKTAALRRSLVLERPVEMATEIEEVLGQCIDESRSLTVELSPPILYNSGLAAALGWLGRYTQEKHGLAVEVRTELGGKPLPQGIEVLLFQFARELIFNAVKHAQATHVDVTLTETADDQVSLEIRDDGRGFDPNQTAERTGSSGGFGLFSVRERLQLAGGCLEIDAAPGRGSRFVLHVPQQPEPTPPPAIATG